MSIILPHTEKRRSLANLSACGVSAAALREPVLANPVRFGYNIN